MKKATRHYRLRVRLLTGLVVAVGLPGIMPTAKAQERTAEPTLPAATISIGSLNLEECLRIAMEQQPALVAYRASLASANAGYHGVNNMPFVADLIARDLPIRRRQACLGVSIAAAGLTQAEIDTAYAVSRTYYGVLFARAQLHVAEDLASGLRFYQERVRDLVNKGESREWTTSTVDKITIYLRLAETRQAEAAHGIDRATAALREAMGVPPEVPVEVVDEKLPSPTVAVTREQIVALALTRRGELAQAANAEEVAKLEVDAQSKTHRLTSRTFASGADVHATPVPQGFRNGEYRPGATSLEMPVELAGPKTYRVDRARDLSQRAAAVVEKTRNLIALDAEDAFGKWVEWSKKIPQTRDAAEAGTRLAKNTRDDFRAGQKVKIEDILTNEVISAQAQGSYNEALYRHLIALADLERVTAGGFQAGLAKRPANQAPAQAR